MQLEFIYLLIHSLNYEKKEIAGKQLCTLDAGDDAVMKRHQMPVDQKSWHKQSL